MKGFGGGETVERLRGGRRRAFAIHRAADRGEEEVRLLPVGFALAVLLTAQLPGQDLAPGALLLERVKEHGRATFEHIPDYACLETVERYRLSRSVRPFDTLHLEVAVVGGKELFARKGAAQFQGDDPTAFVTAGMIGTGDFSVTPHNLFVSDAGWITAPSEAGLSGRKPLRFEFEVPAQSDAYQVQTRGVKASVGVRGAFWVDPQSLDLLRIEQHDVDLPAELKVRDIVTTIAYARTRIGSSNPLLPHSSEVTVTDSYGGRQRNVIEFSGCREYRSDSTVHFEEVVPEPAPAAPPPGRFR